MIDDFLRKRRNAREYNQATANYQANPAAQSLTTLGLGQQQPAGYGVLQPGNTPLPGQQPPGYGVLQPQHFTNTDATNAAAGPAIDWGAFLSGLAAMSAGSGGGGMQAPPPMHAPMGPPPRPYVPLRIESLQYRPIRKPDDDDRKRKLRGLLESE